jgi:uncharacterized membrane protein
VADRERNLDRLLTVVDAIVAIAMTLLVLPLAGAGKEVRTGGWRTCSVTTRTRLLLLLLVLADPAVGLLREVRSRQTS